MIDITLNIQVALMILFSYFGLTLFVLKYGEVRTKLLWVGTWAILLGWLLSIYRFQFGLALLVVGALLLAYYIARFLSTIFSQI